MAKKSSGREKMSNETNNTTKKTGFYSLNLNLNTNGYTFVGIISIILLSAILAININAFLWISKLEKINCECSNNYMRNYIKYFLYFMIPIIIIQLCLAILFTIIVFYMNMNNITSISKLYNLNYISYKAISFLMYIVFYIGILFTICYIINVCFVIIYINKLKESNCECSEDIRREVYWIYNIIMASIYCISIIQILISIILAVSYFAFIIPIISTGLNFRFNLEFDRYYNK